MARQPKSARAKTVSDDIYNARKRLGRSGLRNLKKSKQTTGATSAKYRRLAEQELKAAISTYEVSGGKKQNYLKEIRELAEGLNLNLSQQLEQTRRVEGQQLSRVVNRSYDTLESRLQNPQVRRERQARAILNNDEIGSRILGGLVEVWRDKATVWDETTQKRKVDNEKIYDILTDYFKVDSIADVLDKLQDQFGARLYDVSEEGTDIYEVIKLMIQSKVADNTLVQ